MEWSRLLSRERFGSSGRADEARTAFERDYGRILFSNPFRRLHNKTQVFPVPENDHIHSRLTHSLEVADVGRTLGHQVGLRLADALGSADPRDLGDVVAAACLAHDIGNPPFGHAGEDAIGHFFEQGGGKRWADELPQQQADDLRYFEGNAQGFRIIARLEMYRHDGGMRLSAATLGAFTKYPQSSLRRKDRSRPASGKKYGFFASDQAAFAGVAEACGLPQHADDAWARHPLAFLMEAADDICYHVLDLEDGFELRLVDEATTYDGFARLLERPLSEVSGKPIGMLRAQAISALVAQVVDVFCAEHEAILAGSYEQALTDSIPAAAAMSHVFDEVNMPLCYRAPLVLSLEQAGYRVIGSLLEIFLDSLLGDSRRRVHQMIPGLDATDDLYARIQLVLDYISGMTDRYAVKLYRQLTGIELSSF